MPDLIVYFVTAVTAIAVSSLVIGCWWLNGWIHDRTDRALRRRFDQPAEPEGTTTDG